MKLFLILSCFVAVVAAALFLPSEEEEHEKATRAISASSTMEVKVLDKAIKRSNIQSETENVPPQDLFESFMKDLSLLFALETGREFRFKQQRDKVEMLLAEGKATPVEGIPRLLVDAGSLIPIESLDQFLLLGLSEMNFVLHRYSAQANALKFSAPSLTDGNDASVDKHQLAAIALQEKIRATPTAYPPETIFFAFSEGLDFPTGNIDLIQALGRSRDKGILLASSSWMEYTAWINTAQWQNSFPEYAEHPLSEGQLKAIPQIAEAYRFYLETEQLYLSSILGDMAAYGYLK